MLYYSDCNMTSYVLAALDQVETDAMFEKTLQDLVKGVRAHKDNEAEYINKALGEIREELKVWI